MQQKTTIRNIKLVKIDSLISFVDEVLDKTDLSLTGVCTKMMGVKQGHTLRNIYQRSTKDPTIRFLNLLTESLPGFKEELLGDKEFDFEYINVVHPDDWKKRWDELFCSEAEFYEAFASKMGLKKSSTRNYITAKRVSVYPRLNTAMAFSSYFLYKQSEVDKYKNYKELKTVNMSTSGKKLQDIENFKKQFWNERNKNAT